MKASNVKQSWLVVWVAAILSSYKRRRGLFRVTGALRISSWPFMLFLLGCTGGSHSDLVDYIKEVNARPAGAISPMPDIKPYDAFVYGAHGLRSPFRPATVDVSDVQAGPADCSGDVRPDMNRRKEELEGYALESLSMVGTWKQNENNWALIQGSDKKLYRARVGDYVGLNYGMITEISETEVKIKEIISDGQGCFEYRPTRLSVIEQ